jgi:hypothetical protein
MSSRFRASLAIFLAVAALLVAVHGHRVVATNDEGIVLDAAQRVAGGERPYVDFWAYMTPGSYWLQALVFHLFGVSFLAGRAIVIVDFAVQCALVFWLTARLASLRAATVVAFAFFGFQLADPTFLTAQHRWDSSTLALAGVSMAISAASPIAWIATGAVLAYAAWCTPTVGGVLCVVVAWLCWQRERRKALLPLIVGASVVFAAGAAWLAATGGLLPLIHQLLWLRTNYLVNAMPYGSIIGGYRALFVDLAGALDLAVRALLVTCVALPAWLPIVALVAWGLILWKKKVAAEQASYAVLLLLAGGALILGLSPRPDVTHLAFVVALPYVLAGSAISILVPARAGAPLGICAALLALVFASNSFNSLRSTSVVASPVGNLRVDNAMRSSMETLLATVRSGDSMFVYPYMPMNYFITQARNPTEFSFFSPGMATTNEETVALKKLAAHPPEWVLYATVSREQYLRVVPEGGKTAWRYTGLEEWIEKNYEPVPHADVDIYGYQLRRRIHAAQSSVKQSSFDVSGAAPTR